MYEFIGPIIGMEIIFAIIIVALPNIAKKLAIQKVKKENMNKIDFSKEKNYYRDILDGYSPAELRYIDDFKVNGKREIVATLLSLKLKNKIKIEANKIIVLDLNVSGLNSTERFVLRSIEDGKVKINTLETIEDLARDEATQDGLIIKNKAQQLLKTSTLVIITIWILLQIILLFYYKQFKIGKNFIMDFVIIIIFLIVAFITFNVIPAYIKTYSLMKSNSYKRTEKGEELNEKIEGLKKYMEDYSLLNQKNQEELTLWEEYLIYSVIFDLNSTTIVEDIYKLIDII